MDEKNNGFDELEDLKKYNHYAQDEDVAEEYVPPVAVNEDNADTPAKSDEYEDISSYSGEDKKDFFSSMYEEEFEPESEEEVAEAPEEEGNFFTRNHYRNAKITALIVVIALLLSAGGFLFYVWWSTRSEGYGKEGKEIHQIDEKDYLVDEDMNFKAMGDVDADSLNGWLKAWANNGEKMHSKNVINVLLCGVDSKDGTATNARSDSMILISVNKKTEKITMISLLRDSWTYIKAPRADGSTYDYYFKMNAAYSLGGPATLIETVENNFKIEIDQYIAVDFKSFPKLIDALGGVTVDVQQYESDFIRRTSSQKNFPSGKAATLNGKQALIYSRIRHCDSDSDVSRTRRQRSVIKALIESAKTASKGQLLNAFKQVSGYMRTGYKQSEVLKLIAQAYTHKWMEFEMTELMIPNEDYKDRFSTYINSQSCWVVDYAICAQKIQKAIYGTTNIFLADDRVSPLDFSTSQRTTDSSSDYNTTRSYYDDDDEDETTQSYYDDDEDEDVTDEPQTEEPTEEPQEEPTEAPQEEPQDEGSEGEE